MAAATIYTKSHADANKTFMLAGARPNGALYKDAAQSLQLPHTLEFKYLLGTPGAKGNDRLQVILARSVQNSASGLIFTGSAKLEVSIPRDSAWASPMTEDIINNLMFLGGGNAAYSITFRESLADAIVP